MLGNLSSDTNLRSGQVFSTQHLAAFDQFEGWRQHVADIIELVPNREQADGFSAQSTRWAIGDLIFTHAVFSQAPERSWRHRPQSCLDHWCLVLARTGRETDAHVSENTGLTRKLPSQSPPSSVLSFRSLALPFEGGGQDEEVVTLLLPRTALPQLDGKLGSALNPDIPPAMQGLLAGYLTTLARTLPQLPPGQANALAEPTAALIAACVAPTLERIEVAALPLSSTIIERATRVVRQNMASPDFGPDQLCRLLAMSRSKLYRHFEKFGGVASFIQRERLGEAFARLGDRGAIHSIHQIAESVGFHDHSTFSRAFRREFGFSPSVARERALAGSAG